MSEVLETNAVVDNLKAKRTAMQGVVDRLHEHFIVNKARPGFYNGGCAYRTPQGDCCAVGLFLPEEIAGSLSGSVWTLRSFPSGPYSLLPVDDMAFWERLQNAHDRAAHNTAYLSEPEKGDYFRGDFEGSLRHIAKIHRLHYPGDAPDDTHAIEAMISEGGRP